MLDLFCTPTQIQVHGLSTNEKIQIIPKQILNYKMGIEKLEEANVIVRNLKTELIALEPMQIAKKIEVEALIVDLDKSTKLVEIEKTKIQGDKERCCRN